MQTDTSLDADTVELEPAEIAELDSDNPEEPEALKLPQPAEPRFAFYAVFLKNDRNEERGETGPYKAVLIEDYKTSLIANPEHRHKPIDPRNFVDPAELRRAREFPETLVILDEYGHPKKFARRAWRLVHNRERHLFEDRLATLANRSGSGISDSVYRVQLWCPVLGRDFLGNRKEHGEFLGVDEDSAGVGRRQKRKGVCPECVKNETLDKAAEVIADQIIKTCPERKPYA